MKYLIILLLGLISPWFLNHDPDPNSHEDSMMVESDSFTHAIEGFAGPCDSVVLFVQQLRTIPPSCCFQLIIDNKLKNGIQQIKLDIGTAEFTDIIVEINQGWIVSQTLQKDILLSHNSGFIPLGGSSPLTFCLKGGNNPDSLKMSFNYSALGSTGTCNSNQLVCSNPVIRPKCDSISASFTPVIFPASPFACLREFNISNQASGITQIQVTLKTAVATSGISGNPPFVGNFNGQTLFITHPSTGFIPIGNYNPVDYLSLVGSNPDTAVIKFIYNNGLSSCDTNIIFNCPVPPPPKSKCDSVSAFILPFQALPYACTFQFHIKNQATAISKIQIDLKTTTFNSAGIVSPFSPVIGPNSRLTITAPSPFIPIGNFHVTDLGINIGSNPDTAIVKFFYNNGLSTCDTNIIFNCPVDTTCGYSPSCAINTISLNTGLDKNGQLLSPGSYDPNWSIIRSPYTGSILPSPAEVIQKYSSWDFQPNATAPCSQWISVFQGANQQNNVSFLDPYTYSRCFCVCKDSAKITIQLSAMADNNANFRLYDASGNVVAPLLAISYPNNLPQAFQLPPDQSTTNLILRKGTYCIRADVRNYANVTGINVCGSVSGAGLIRADCCESQSYIVGHKYQDTQCNGLPYTNQPTLPGWQMVLCNASGVALDTVITDVNGYYGFGPIPSGNYTVKEINQPGWTLSNPANNVVQVALTSHEVKEVNFGNCPPTTCDSISFWVESLKTIPPGCCFRLHIDNKVKNKFTQIPITLQSAAFNTITVDNFNGWFASQSNLSNINLMFNANNSTFIPVGNFTPLSWCINAGSNPDTIHIKTDYLVGPTKVSCDTSFVFFCPPQPDTLCGPACKADSISLNTGVDHSTGMFYAPGKPDPYWTVTHTPYPAYILPKPAYALATPSYWHNQPNATMPCSRWINFSGGPYHYDEGLYEFTRCFCVCRDRSNIQIHLSALADNWVEFTLCDSSGFPIAYLMPPKTTGPPFLNPPKDTTVNVILDRGRYCIKASVMNYGHTYTGLNVCGSIKGTGLVKEICCEPSTITGIKYLDTACVGLPYNGTQQGLQGWQIILCNNLGVPIDTMITDINGSYSFSPLLPGLYTVKELNPTGWTASSPASGMSSIFLGANQVSQLNFGNCPPEIDSCCKSKSLFAQHIMNAVQLVVIDSLCKAKVNIRLPACDSARLINWGDGQITQGPFSNGMWMHTYTQSGLYTIQIPITEYDANGKPCFDTLLKYTIELYCTCECGNYNLSIIQDGIKTPSKCNDTIRFGCPAPQSIFLTGHFNCVGSDSCIAPNVQWTLTGPSVNLSGSVYAGNILIPIPGALMPGFYTLNLQTTCGQKKCSCKITLFQRPCIMSDSCTTYCNGTSWTQLNTSRIEDMVIYQGRLIAAGLFNSIGNPSVSANNIAAWNGTNWAPLIGGGLNNVVFDLEVHNGLLYAGGQFTLAGNITVSNIATWNGTAWANIPQGGTNGPNTNVYTMLSTSSGLFVGGLFNSIGTTVPVLANNVALLHSAGWASLNTGLNGQVRSLSIYNAFNQVVAGGRFGSGFFNHVAIWNGSFWTKLGLSGAVNITTTPPNSGDGVHDIISVGNDLIIGGQFLNALDNNGNAIANTQHIARYNGTTWVPMGSGVNSGVGIYDLYVANNELLAGGRFTSIGNQAINLLAKWNGVTWSTLNHPSIGIVRSIIVYGQNNSNCNLYTGGEVLFNQWKCSGVAAADKSSNLSISIFPNPVKDKIHIQFNEVLSDKVFISMYSLLGAQVINHSFISMGQTGEMDISGLPTGTYLIKVYTKKGSVVKKVVKR